MADETVTHRDLAQELGISETTIKSYRRKFGDFIPVHSRGKPLRFKPLAMDICRTIRDSFQNDLSVSEVRAKLKKEFPDVINVYSKSVSAGSSAKAAPPAGWEQALLQRLDRLADVQEEANRSIGALHAVLAEFVQRSEAKDTAMANSVDDLKKAWSDQLLGLRRVVSGLRRASLHPQEYPPEPLQAASSRKRVTVQNAYGGKAEYVFETLADAAEQPAKNVAASRPGESRKPQKVGPQGATPDSAYGNLPLVIQSSDEFLGVAGKSEGHFSLNDFIQLLQKAHPAPKHFDISWEQTPHGWRVSAQQAQTLRPQSYALETEQTTTPKGNNVAMLTRLVKDGAEQPPANLYAFIKSMRS